MKVLTHFTNIQAFIHIKETYKSAIVDLDGSGKVVILVNESDLQAYDDAWAEYMESKEFPLELIYH